VCDGLLQILHLARHPKAFVQSCCQINKHIRAIGMRWRA
jgi:hypothetical protein